MFQKLESFKERNSNQEQLIALLQIKIIQLEGDNRHLSRTLKSERQKRSTLPNAGGEAAALVMDLEVPDSTSVAAQDSEEANRTAALAQEIAALKERNEKIEAEKKELLAQIKQAQSSQDFWLKQSESLSDENAQLLKQFKQRDSENEVLKKQKEKLDQDETNLLELIKKQREDFEAEKLTLLGQLQDQSLKAEEECRANLEKQSEMQKQLDEDKLYREAFKIKQQGLEAETKSLTKQLESARKVTRDEAGLRNRLKEVERINAVLGNAMQNDQAEKIELENKNTALKGQLLDREKNILELQKSFHAEKTELLRKSKMQQLELIKLNRKSRQNKKSNRSDELSKNCKNVMTMAARIKKLNNCYFNIQTKVKAAGKSTFYFSFSWCEAYYLYNIFFFCRKAKCWFEQATG